MYAIGSFLFKLAKLFVQVTVVVFLALVVAWFLFNWGIPFVRGEIAQPTAPAASSQAPMPIPGEPTPEPTPVTESQPAPAAEFDSAWTVSQLKSWVLAGQGYEEQNGRFWQIINYAKEKGQLHWSRSKSDPYDCLGVPEVMNQWGSQDSCAIWQSTESLNGTFVLEISKFDQLFKQRKWIDGQMVFWNTAAVRFGGSSDLVAYVRYGNEASQTCQREFELPEGKIEVVFVNTQPGGQHQITFGETEPSHVNECHPAK